MNFQVILEGNSLAKNERMSIDGYKLNEIPDLSKYEWLIKLSLQNNSITNIRGDYLPPNLEELDLQRNDIKELDIDKPIKSLKILDLSYNDITEFDSSLFPNLTHLDLQNNKLTEFLNYPPNLIELNIAGNSIDELGDFPEHLSNLLCECNNLDKLPQMNEELTDVDFDQNEFTEFPEFPDSVVNINFNYNKIESIESLPEKLEYLSIFDNEISKINCVLPEPLIELDLSSNSLTEMPGLPPNIKKVDISNNMINELVDIPESTETLNCSNNYIRDFPAELFRRPQLTMNNRNNMDSSFDCWNVNEDTDNVIGGRDDDTDPFVPFSGAGHRLGDTNTSIHVNTPPYYVHHNFNRFNVRTNPFENKRAKDDNPNYVSILTKKKVVV